SMELRVTMDPGTAKQCGVKVRCSPDGEEETLIYYDAEDKKLKIDTTKSSLTGKTKTVEGGPFALSEDELLTLRIFVDKSIVEVFSNDRQAVMRRIYPSRADSVDVKLFAQGGTSKAQLIEAWEMMPSNPH
ncbi:MAG: GH32 C-terminal domain-containing protein, partial [Pirellulales bacterium]|nr:GH32 C-terminal domain-containing protein [Pirellulales bacterium]